MLPPGLCTQVLTHKSSLRCCDGGFLTWAAKPSVRESPDPANDVALFLTSHLCTGRLPTPDTTQSPRWKFPWSRSALTFPWTVHASFR